MPMKTITLNNGLKIPVIGLGTWLLQPEEVGPVLESAFSLGYRHIDGASSYDNETALGESYSKYLKDGKGKREDLYVTSKLWCSDFSKEDVVPACKKTLKDLQLNYLDLYLVHAPVQIDKKMTPEVSPEDFPKFIIGYTKKMMMETWRQLECLVEQGLVKSIGVSNFTVKKLKDLLEFAKIKPVCNQVELHPYLPQEKLKSFCHDNGILCVAYAPLGSPNRSAMFVDDSNEERLLDNEVVKSVAAKHKCSAAQAILSWGINRGTSAIPKSVSPSRLDENLKSIEVHLDASDMKALNDIEERVRYFKIDFLRKSNQSLDELWDGEMYG